MKSQDVQNDIACHLLGQERVDKSDNRDFLGNTGQVAHMIDTGPEREDSLELRHRRIIDIEIAPDHQMVNVSKIADIRPDPRLMSRKQMRVPQFHSAHEEDGGHGAISFSHREKVARRSHDG